MYIHKLSIGVPPEREREEREHTSPFIRRKSLEVVCNPKVALFLTYLTLKSTIQITHITSYKVLNITP